MIPWFSTLALAADLSPYPSCAEVAVPAAGPARIHVPLDLRSADDPGDGSDLVLVDATGREVPFARLEGDPHGDPAQQVEVAATVTPGVYRLAVGPMPIDALEVYLPAAVPAARVTVTDAAGTVVADDVLVWSLPDTVQPVVPITGARPVSGTVEVDIAPTTAGMSLQLAPRFAAVRRRAPPIPPETLEIAVGPVVVQENGWARTSIQLPRALPVDRVRVEAADPIFSRRAGLTEPYTGMPGYGWQSEPPDPTTIARVALGALSIASTVVPRPSGAGGVDRLSLLIDANGQTPLAVDRVTVEIDGVDLAVLDAGPGPHALCGGAAPGTTLLADLSIAGPELARLGGAAIQPGPVADNPAWVPPEIRSNLGTPGTPLDDVAFAWRRPVTGEGLVRIPVPPEVLAIARPDLGDLRLVADGRQIPFVAVQDPNDVAVDGVTLDRTERGSDTRLEVAVPTAGTWVSRLAIASPAALFTREVTVGVPGAGGRVQVLRMVQWTGNARSAPLVIELAQPIGDRLIVTVANGDDPPLPVDGVTVYRAAWDLVATLPPGGAELLYGGPTVDAPNYDLAMLTTPLLRRTIGEATVGPASAVRRPALTLVDRGLLAVGIGALALGLLGLAADLVRRLPAAAAADTPNPA
ncbi:MAG: hypothetical protein ABMB14_07680 [Myxococcota bacterium]